MTRDIKVRPQGEPMMEVTLQRDAEGKLKIDAWIKDVSPSGIILGNKRPAAPIEICHLLACCEMNILAISLPAAAALAKMQQEKGGSNAEQGPAEASSKVQ